MPSQTQQYFRLLLKKIHALTKRNAALEKLLYKSRDDIREEFRAELKKQQQDISELEKLLTDKISGIDTQVKLNAQQTSFANSKIGWIVAGISSFMAAVISWVVSQLGR